MISLQKLLHNKFLPHFLLALLVFTAFFVNVGRYDFLGDDSFIAFRYSKNLVDGHGLVFNPGERVEGYTSFLWVLCMALGMNLGISPESFSFFLGILSGIAILLTLIFVSCTLVPNRSFWIWVAPLCLAFNRTFCAWSTGGLETQFFAFLVLFASAQYIRESSNQVLQPLLSSLLFGLATLTRPEGALFFAVTCLFFCYEVLIPKRRPVRSLLKWSLPYLLIVGGHVVWRYNYYGDLLPNTFYVKVSGFWWKQSSIYLSLFIRDYLLFFWLPFLLVFLWHRTNLIYNLFCSYLLAYTSYIIYIGGDAFEFRFMTPIIPFLYWMLQEALRLTFVNLQSARLVIKPLEKITLIAVFFLIVSSAIPLIKPFKSQHFINSIEVISQYAQRRSKEGKFLGFLIEKGNIKKDTLIAVGGSGALPYYCSLPTIDIHGLNDTTIARSPVINYEKGNRGRIGHEKVATREYIRKREVAICDLFNQIIFEDSEQLFKALEVLTQMETPYFKGPVRCIEAEGKYIVFGTTLSEEEFAETFERFIVHQ
jgi:hypothetical protein